MDPSLQPSELTARYESYTLSLLDKHCPEKQVFSRVNDKPFMTEDMKIIKRKIMREYQKHGKTQKYFDLKSVFKEKLQNEALKYKKKIMDDVATGNIGHTYAAL